MVRVIISSGKNVCLVCVSSLTHFLLLSHYGPVSQKDIRVIKNIPAKARTECSLPLSLSLVSIFSVFSVSLSKLLSLILSLALKSCAALGFTRYYRKANI